MSRHTIAIFVVLSVILAGCSRQSEPKEVVPPLQLLFQKVRSEMDTNNVSRAIEILDAAYVDEEFAEDRSQILNASLSIRLSSDMVDEAVTKFTAAVNESPEIAEHSFAMLASALRGADDPSALLSLTTSLLEAPFSDRTKENLYVNHAFALAANDQKEQALKLVPKCREAFSSASCLRIYGGMISSSSKSGDTALTLQYIEEIARAAKGEPEFLELVTVSRLDILAGTGNWKDYTTLLSREIDSLSSTGLNSAFARAMRAAADDGQRALRDSICVLIIEARKPNEPCFVSAARKWLDSASTKEPNVVPMRTKALIDKGISADALLRFLPKAFYAVLNLEDAEKLGEMMSMTKQLTPSVTDERNRTTVNSMLLDGSFILNDYATAIAMVEAGVPGRDEDWHASALVKLKAHRALDAGNTEEAVKHFRSFMDVIAETMHREVDPSSGMTYTADWCLGRNAKRIGDILNKAGESDRAAKAYKEAKGHFEKALNDFDKGSKEFVAIEKEMAEVPNA